MNAKFAGIVAVVALVLSSAGAAQQSPESAASPEQYTAVASNISEVGGSGVTALDITIHRYTTAAEDERLMSILTEKGQDPLVDALRKLKALGNMRTPGNLAYDFHYARQTTEKDGRRRVMLVTDRPVGFAEMRNSSITLEYPFTLLDLRIDASGHGEGQLFLATKFIRSGNLLVLENFATRPIVISSIRPRK